MHHYHRIPGSFRSRNISALGLADALLFLRLLGVQAPPNASLRYPRSALDIFFQTGDRSRITCLLRSRQKRRRKRRGKEKTTAAAVAVLANV